MTPYSRVQKKMKATNCCKRFRSLVMVREPVCQGQGVKTTLQLCKTMYYWLLHILVVSYLYHTCSSKPSTHLLITAWNFRTIQNVGNLNTKISSQRNTLEWYNPQNFDTVICQKLNAIRTIIPQCCVMLFFNK